MNLPRYTHTNHRHINTCILATNTLSTLHKSKLFKEIKTYYKFPKIQKLSTMLKLSRIWGSHITWDGDRCLVPLSPPLLVFRTYIMIIHIRVYLPFTRSSYCRRLLTGAISLPGYTGSHFAAVLIVHITLVFVHEAQIRFLADSSLSLWKEVDQTVCLHMGVTRTMRSLLEVGNRFY
jgi:hypothetical protein